MVLKSASRGVQWIEPDLSRQLAVIWKIAEKPVILRPLVVQSNRL